MLSVHDRGVAARDPGLPGLPLLLDPDALLTWLQENPPLVAGWADSPVAVTCRYLRYKPGVRLLGAFELSTATGCRLPFQAWAVGEGGRQKLEKAIREVPPPFAPGRCWCRELRVMVQFHPDDRDLPSLARFADPEARERLLARRLPSMAGRFSGPLRILSYNPERRFVALLHDSEGPAAVVRGHTPDRFGRSQRGARAFRTVKGGFRIPRLLGASRGSAVLVQEWLQGRPLELDPWRHGAPAEAASLSHHVGRALRSLHTQEARGLRRAGGSGLTRALAGIEAVRPGDTTEAARRAVRWLRPLLHSLEEALPPAAAPLHGDLHPGQILVSDEGLGLVDFDRAGVGDPLRDLATFVAHLEAGRAEGTVPAAVATAAESSLLDGYRNAGGVVDLDRFQWQCAAALLRRAPHPFRARTPEWPAAIDALVARACHRLSHAGGPRDLP